MIHHRTYVTFANDFNEGSVKLPNGTVWMDKEVIQKHLMDQSSDPFDHH